MRRLLVFGAQHPDLAQMFRSRWRSSSRYRERATESLAELGAGSREAVLRWLDVGPDLPPPSLLQPLSTLAQCLAAAQLSASGLRWDGAIGVSMGEAAAAVLCGALPRGRAVHLAGVIGELSERPSSGGLMIFVRAPAPEVEPLARRAGVHIAVHFGPSLTILAGSVEGIDRALELARERGLGAGRLHLPHAFHTPLVARLERVFERLGGGLSASPPTTPLFSCVTGARVSAFDADHWWRIVSRRCLFREAARAALLDGYRELVAVDDLVGPLHSIREEAEGLGVSLRALTLDQLAPASSREAR